MLHVPSRALRLPQSAVAIVLIAALASWQPAMLVTMTRMTPDVAHPAHAGHGARHSGAPHHHTLPFQCCTLCPLACAGVAAPPSAPLAAAPAALARTHRPQGHRSTARAPVRQHRLPFPLGPPTLRIA